MRRVLVLRPEPGASATVKRARERGLDAVAVPLFRVEALAWKSPDPAEFDGILLTSANAIRMAGEQLKDLCGLPVFAVGEATASVAREGGFDVPATGSAGVDRLLGSIDPGFKLLHLCGADRREPRDAPQTITSLPVYRAREIDKPDLSAAAGSVSLIHSPRAGRRFAALVGERSNIAIAAISDAAAAAAGEGWEQVEIAEGPNGKALLALAARLCNKPPPK